MVPPNMVRTFDGDFLLLVHRMRPRRRMLPSHRFSLHGDFEKPFLSVLTSFVGYLFALGIRIR